jgi:hypothetical protein
MARLTKVNKALTVLEEVQSFINENKHLTPAEIYFNLFMTYPDHTVYELDQLFSGAVYGYKFNN